MADEVPAAPAAEVKPAVETPVPAPAPEVKADAPATPEAPKEEKPGKRPWFQERIDQLTREKNEERRAREAAEARAMAIEKPGEATATELTPEVLERLADARADQKITQREIQKRVETWVTSGRADFKDFDQRCELVANMGATEKPEFMQIVTDMPDGHKVVAALADDPEAAQRILAMPGYKMAMELQRLSDKIAAPKAKEISSAPAPIKPVDGAHRVSDEPDQDDDMDTFAAKWRAKAAAKKMNGSARF